MPQIVVFTDPLPDAAETIVYRERVAPTDLLSDYFSGQLIERVGWAVVDADELEHKCPAPESHLADEQARSAET